MDALHAEVREAEARTPPPSSLGEMRMSFTHLHVAAEVAARTIELTAPPAAEASGSAHCWALKP